MNALETDHRAMRRPLLRVRPASLQACFALVAALACLVCAPRPAQAFTVVQVSTAAPPGLEAAFIASATSQFTATVVTNPFFRGTFNVLLQNVNPNFNPAPKMQDLLNALVTVDSFTYVYGWSDGQYYERGVDLGKMFSYENNCSSPTFFGAVAIDSATCLSVLGTLANEVYTQNFSTPTAVSGF